MTETTFITRFSRVKPCNCEDKAQVEGVDVSKHLQVGFYSSCAKVTVPWMAPTHSTSLLIQCFNENIAAGILSVHTAVTHVPIKAQHAVFYLNYCCFLNRQFSSCDETGLKRSASYPLIHSESFQLATTEGKQKWHRGNCSNRFQGFSQVSWRAANQ